MSQRSSRRAKISTSMALALFVPACSSPAESVALPALRMSTSEVPMLGHEGDPVAQREMHIGEQVRVVAGGRTAASRFGADCRGWVGLSPIATFELGAEPLVRVLARGEIDLTLVVRGPAGQTLCNDDSDGLNPMVELVGAAPGVYSIYVGTYAQGGSGAPADPAVLEISSDATRTPSALVRPPVALGTSFVVSSASGADMPALGSPCTIDVSATVADPNRNRWLISCGTRNFYAGELPASDPTWAPGVRAIDTQLSRQDGNAALEITQTEVHLRDGDAATGDALELTLTLVDGASEGAVDVAP